jgi:hypothetical protein
VTLFFMQGMSPQEFDALCGSAGHPQLIFNEEIRAHVPLALAGTTMRSIITVTSSTLPISSVDSIRTRWQ